MSRALALIVSVLLAVPVYGVLPVTASEPETTGLPAGDGAQTWEAQESGTTQGLLSVHFTDADTGWAVGWGGTIVATTDGGDTWEAQSSGTTRRLESVHFTDADTGWAVGEAGTIIATTNGGDKWMARSISFVDWDLYSVHVVDTDTIWVVGQNNIIYSTMDGGATWRGKYFYPEKWLRSVYFVDADTGWAVGTSGTILATTNGGDTWRAQTSGTTSWLRSVHFADADTGWAVGSGGTIVATTDGGDTWSEQTGGTAYLYSVHFADADTGWAVNSAGDIITTDDGGETWERQSSGLGMLYSVHFANIDTGWVVGPEGKILHYGPTTAPDPTDPTDDPTDPTDPTDPDDGDVPGVINIAGGTRYETAVEASKLAFPDGADTVVIATGRNWPDALGGSALAGALGAPILLVNTASVPDVVSAEIARLEATTAVIVGGEFAVGPEVATALEGAGMSTQRVAGTNRYETADAVALRVIELLGADYDGTAFVATGGAYADAVAAGPLAASQGWPLYLAHPSSGIRPATLAAMEEVTDVLVLGGPAAVSTGVENALKTSFGVTRLAGTSRYKTAVKIASHGAANTSLAWNRVGIATGQAYPDALAGGVLQGKVGSVMLLTRGAALSAEPAQALADNKDVIATVTFFGGDAAVSPEVRTAVTQALQ